MKKIMMIVPAVSVGGGEKVAITIAKYIDRTRFEVLLVSLYPAQETIYAQEIEQEKINMRYLHKHGGFDFGVIRELKKVIREFRPDVIHTHLYVVPYVLLAAPRKIKKYHTVHNMADKEAEGLLRIFMRVAYKMGNFVPVTISPYCRKSFEDLYRYKKEIPCIYNGIDTDKFRPLPEAHEGVRLVCVGRFEPQKNQKLLLRAFAEVHKQCPEAILELVGDGYLRSELEALVAELGLGDCVIMEGVSADVAGRLNRADVFVLSSDFEGLPVSVLEAMACGLPVVSTDAGGTRDIVINEENGLIVPVGDQAALQDAMLRLCRDPALRRTMGEKSREYALLRSVDRFVVQYEELYESKK